MNEISILRWCSLLWFFVAWVGYSWYSAYARKTHPRLQDAISMHIRNWITVLHKRDGRIVDTSIITIMERKANFFASTCLLIIAGLVSGVGATDEALVFLSQLPFSAKITPTIWDVGLSVMILIFAYGFFTFTWCIRQWSFAAIMVGSAPLAEDKSVPKGHRETHIKSLSKLTRLATTRFNYGLRAFYFSLAMLGWFWQPWVFMLATTWVVGVLYRREFASRTLWALLAQSESEK